MFKKLGKLTKKINLRGVAKLANNFTSMIPIVGGVASNVVGGAIEKGEQKRAQKNADAEAFAQAQIQQNMANTKSYVEAETMKTNPNIKDILQGALGGALTGTGQVLAGTTQAGQVGATVIDNSITTWLKENVLKVVAGAGVLFLLIFGATRLGKRR